MFRNEQIMISKTFQAATILNIKMTETGGKHFTRLNTPYPKPNSRYSKVHTRLEIAE